MVSAQLSASLARRSVAMALHERLLPQESACLVLNSERLRFRCEAKALDDLFGKSPGNPLKASIALRRAPLARADSMDGVVSSSSNVLPTNWHTWRIPGGWTVGRPFRA